MRFRRRILVLAAILIATGFLLSRVPFLSAAGDSLSELKAAVDSKQPTAAIAILKSLSTKLPMLSDYIAWFRASAEFDAQNYGEVPKVLEPVWGQSPASPLISRAALLAAKGYEQSGNPHAAVSILRKYYDKLPRPQGDLALATALALDNDLTGAAAYDQRVYYNYPTSAEAAQAESDLTKLRTQLGDQYPPVTGSAMLGRASKLIDAGQYEKARKELIAIIPQLTGAERETAQVKLGLADYHNRDTAVAERYLRNLVVEDSEADAERLYYMLLCARRQDRRDDMSDVLERLSRQHPDSKWRLEGAVAVANSYLVENQIDSYEPLYRICYEHFVTDPRAGGCHWKVAWSHYLRRREDAADLLREQVRIFPASEDASAALYFLGRLAEGANDWPAARAYYSEVSREYPNFFYAGLARERMSENKDIASAPGPSPASGFLSQVKFPMRTRTHSFDPNATTKFRIDRAHMLSTAGFSDWAEIELRYAAENEDQPHVAALELARTATHRSAPDEAMRYLKRYASDYLYLPVDSAPMEFWKLAFPIPYRIELERYARQNHLDPYFIAALIRQESEFNPKAVSSSNARGLTQILPTTGRDLSRQLKLRPYSTARLFQPAVNLQLGAFYLRSIADRVDQRWEAVLAAYNAGPSKAAEWLKWGEFREPAEFAETVPFSQTRNYIQVVLRNAEMYRRLYGIAETANANEPDALTQPKKTTRSGGAR